MTFPKNQQTRQRGKTLGEEGADEPFGFEPKPMLDEHHERNLLGGDGLRGSDKSQGELRDMDTRGQPADRGRKVDRSPHRDAQHGADLRGQPSTVQKQEALPEGLRRVNAKGHTTRTWGGLRTGCNSPTNWKADERKESPREAAGFFRPGLFADVSHQAAA